MRAVVLRNGSVDKLQLREVPSERRPDAIVVRMAGAA